MWKTLSFLYTYKPEIDYKLVRNDDSFSSFFDYIDKKEKYFFNVPNKILKILYTYEPEIDCKLVRNDDSFSSFFNYIDKKIYFFNVTNKILKIR